MLAGTWERQIRNVDESLQGDKEGDGSLQPTFSKALD